MSSPYALDPSAEPGAPRYGSVWSDTVDLPAGGFRAPRPPARPELAEARSRSEKGRGIA